MNKHIKWVKNRIPKTDCSEYQALMSQEEIKKVREFHQSFPQYKVTPLHALDKLASELGLGSISIKDESYRFGLNAFKVLGGSYAMTRFIAKTVGRDVSELGYEELTSPETKEALGQYTFFTATDGNHGRGVAWAANQIGQKSVVYMPKGSSETRLNNILKENARASITDMNYDDAVRKAAAEAAETPNGVIIQDTAWKDYEEIPSWVMQGYGTMALEALEQLASNASDDADAADSADAAHGSERPTHVFVQAGVGSLAGAVVGYVVNLFPENPPTIIVVEAGAAACLYESAVQADGRTVDVGGDLETIMAGLACGEANIISWEILKNSVDFFVALPDYVAALGMRVLGAPLKGDPRVISGESGAATLGLLYEMLSNDDYTDFRTAVGLDEDSRVLLFSTEGDTDPDVYRSICWEGAYPARENHDS